MMYVSGLITGSFATFLIASAFIIVIMVRFDDLLWRERAKKIADSRPIKIIIEDCHGNRRVAFEAETTDMRGGEAAAR
jgi:hypothetical protein